EQDAQATGTAGGVLRPLFGFVLGRFLCGLLCGFLGGFGGFGAFAEEGEGFFDRKSFRRFVFGKRGVGFAVGDVGAVFAGEDLEGAPVLGFEFVEDFFGGAAAGFGLGEQFEGALECDFVDVVVLLDRAEVVAVLDIGA